MEAHFQKGHFMQPEVRRSSRSLTLRVDVFGQFERVRVGQVSVSGSDGQDQAALATDELHDHVSDLLLDVGRLVSHRYFSDARQVDEGQIQNCTQPRGQMTESQDIHEGSQAKREPAPG